jgi:hypothetical protein
MNKIERVNSVVIEFERVQKSSEVIVNQLFPEMRVQASKGAEDFDEVFLEKANKTLKELKSSVSSLEGLLEKDNGE